MKKFIIALVLVLSPAISLAAGAPQCNAQNVGMVSCMSQRECECKFFRKSEMAGTPDRFSWDCSLLRPNCGDLSVNAPNSAPAYNGPASVGFSKSDTNMVQSPVTTNTQAQSPTTTLQQQQQSPTTTNTSTSTQTPTQTSTQTDTQTNNQNSTQTNH